MTHSPRDIRTARLHLRLPRPDDLDAMFAIMSLPAVMRYWSTLPHADRAVTEGWLANMIARNAAGGEDFIIEHEGRVVGFVGASRLPEFGFALHPDSWGRGFAQEASAAFIAYAFGTLGEAALTADVDPRNAASLKVLDRLGFAETGRATNTFLLGDEWCHSVYLRLDRPEA
jgi:RimJ/RimL family protein N-acetyltransferase